MRRKLKNLAYYTKCLHKPACTGVVRCYVRTCGCADSVCVELCSRKSVVFRSCSAVVDRRLFFGSLTADCWNTPRSDQSRRLLFKQGLTHPRNHEMVDDQRIHMAAETLLSSLNRLDTVMPLIYERLGINRALTIKQRKPKNWLEKLMINSNIFCLYYARPFNDSKQFFKTYFNFWHTRVAKLQRGYVYLKLLGYHGQLLRIQFFLIAWDISNQ